MSFLSFVLLLLDWESRYHVTNIAMTKLFKLLNLKFLPKHNKALETQVVAKKLLLTIRMDYKKVHACLSSILFINLRI